MHIDQCKGNSIIDGEMATWEFKYTSDSVLIMLIILQLDLYLLDINLNIVNRKSLIHEMMQCHSNKT